MIGLFLRIFPDLDKGITVDNVQGFESTLNDLSISNKINMYRGMLSFTIVLVMLCP